MKNKNNKLRSYCIDVLNYYTNEELKNLIIRKPKLFRHIRKDRTSYNELKELYQFLTL